MSDTVDVGGSGSTPVLDADEKRLHELGYAQELKRGLGGFSNFAISFSIISILAGGVTSFWLGMVAGGPRIILLGWPVVGFFSLMVGMAMAEICSAYPTAGGLYYWTAKLAPKNGARWSWFCGWFNLVGQIGVIASVDYALALFTSFSITMFHDSFVGTPKTVFAIYLALLLVHGLLNAFGVNLVRILGDVSVWWHVFGVLVIVVVLAVMPDNREGLSILTESRNATGWTGPLAGLYAALIGLLLAQYTITGFDASAHVSEETHDAAMAAPQGIVRSIWISAVAAFLLNLAMLQAIPKGAYDDIAGAFGPLSGALLFTGAVAGFMGKALVLISTVGQFFCGMACVTAASRMIYAFSRDGAVPGHRTWHKINHKTRTPTNSVWLAVGLSAVIGALTLVQNEGYAVAFFALTGVAVIGLYISYVIPVFQRLRSTDFVPGPWNLGRWSKTVGWIAVCWVAVICVLFCAPVFWPWLTLNTFNFTLVIVFGTMAVVAIWWQVSAKNWFTGPKVQGTPEELAAIERELSLPE